MNIKKQPIVLLFIFQLVYMVALSFVILVINYIFDMNTSPLILFLFMGSFPAIIYGHQNIMERFGIAENDAIRLTKILAWVQFFIFFMTIIAAYIFMKINFMEVIFLSIIIIVTMYIVRFFGVSMIKKR